MSLCKRASITKSETAAGLQYKYYYNICCKYNYLLLFQRNITILIKKKIEGILL